MQLYTNNTRLTNFKYNECYSLIRLECSRQRLQNLVITSDRLKVLNCSWNNLKTLDISDAEELDELECNDNKLESLVISEKNTKLNILKCQNNKLTKLNIPYPDKITYLDIRNNCMYFVKDYLPTTYYQGKSHFITSTVSYGDETNNVYVFKVKPGDTKVKLHDDFREYKVLSDFLAGSQYKKTDFYIDPVSDDQCLAIRRNVLNQPMPVTFRYKVDPDHDIAPWFTIRFEQEDYTIPSNAEIFSFADVNYPVPGTAAGDMTGFKFKNAESSQYFTMSIPQWINVDNYEPLEADDAFQFARHYVLKFMLTPAQGYRFDPANLPINARVRFYLDEDDDTPFFHADYSCLDDQGRLWIYASPHKKGFIHSDSFSPTGEYTYGYGTYYAVDGAAIKIPTLASAAVFKEAPDMITVKNYAIIMRENPDDDPKLPDYWCRIPTATNAKDREYEQNPFWEDGELTFSGLEMEKRHNIHIATGKTAAEALENEAAGRYFVTSIYLPEQYQVSYQYDAEYPELFAHNFSASYEPGGIPECPVYPAWADSEGYILEEYYLDSAFKYQYRFDKPVGNGSTLYAKMKKTETVTVTFDRNGQNTSMPLPPAQTVIKGHTITKPSDPTASSANYKFGGWFVNDPACQEKNRFSFSSPVNENIILYARWLNVSGGEAIYSVNYWMPLPDELDDVTGFTLTKAETQQVKANECAVRPYLDPNYTEKNGTEHIFKGWKKKGDTTNTFYDFSTPVTANLDLEAMYFEPPTENDFTIAFIENEDNGFVYNDITKRYEQKYLHRAVRPTVDVRGPGGVFMTVGVDYTLKYANNRNVSKAGKPATVTVTGKGRFKGKTVLPFYIMPLDIGAEENYDPDYYEYPYDLDRLDSYDDHTSLIKIPAIMVQENSKIDPVIYYNGYRLGKDDFTISNTGKVTSDTTISIYGKGNFTGQISGIPVKVLSKATYDASTLKVTLNAKKHEYTADKQILTVATPSAPGELTVKNASGDILTEGVHFSVHYLNYLDVGTATVVIHGKAPYTGTVTKTFKIDPAKTAVITHSVDDVYLFPGQTKVIPVSDGDLTGRTNDVNVSASFGPDYSNEDLIAGKDYKISFSKNKAAGKGEYKITFLGNYKGVKSVKGKFNIVPYSYYPANAGDSVYVPDVVYNPKKSNKSTPIVTVQGIGISSRNYTVKYYDGDTEITSKKITLAADEQYKKITVKVTGRRDLKTDTPAEGYYYIRKNPSGSGLINLSKAKIVGKGTKKAIKAQAYTGYVIRPEIDVLIKKGKKWVKVDPSCYTVTYANCIAKGNGTLYITGVDSKAVGSKTAKFKIGIVSVKKLFQSLWRP